LTQVFINIFHEIPPLDHTHITFSFPICPEYYTSTYYYLLLGERTEVVISLQVLLSNVVGIYHFPRVLTGLV